MYLIEDMNRVTATQKAACIHCGADCALTPINTDFGTFCCNGCSTVYEMLHEAGFDQYYKLNNTPGSTPVKEDYTVLDQPEVFDNIIRFKDTQKAIIAVKVPAIHCASCVWLLEKLNRLQEGIISSRVNLGKRELTVSFNFNEIPLSQIFSFLASIGYAPEINLSQEKIEDKPSANMRLIKKTALAGFCFGNIMLFTFPAYFGLEQSSFFKFFNLLNAILAVPVIFYCASDYWKAGKAFISENVVSVDLPILIGLIAFAVQSYYEVISGTGEGYFDSLCGLIFFLLCGKIFQDKLHRNLSFDRDYKSFFPLWSRKVINGKEESCLVNNLGEGDVLRVRQNELIPCDSQLLSENAKIDYSFVTGEYEPVSLKKGEKIYAGGRQVGGAIDLKITSKCSTSYLTTLWNDLKSQKSEFTSFSDKISRLFTPIILFTAFILASLWISVGIAHSLRVFISVLIIACPCALALSAPFTYGFAGRRLNKFKFFMKNGAVIEKLSRCNAIVFDKTGTLSSKNQASINFSGMLTKEDRIAVFSICSQSVHPISRQICNYLNEETQKLDFFTELAGAGLKGSFKGKDILIGSPKFVGYSHDGGTWVKIDGEVKGYFNSDTVYREGLKKSLEKLSDEYHLYLLSGDNEREIPLLKSQFGDSLQMHFNQSPQDKMKFIKQLQSQGLNTLMIGDGLNDAGALKTADTGIAVTEDISHFFPACDALLDAAHLKDLHKFTKFSRWCNNLIHFNFGLSITYNLLGISAAGLGLISPLFCAVLMPASSFTILLSSALGTYIGSQIYLKESN